MLPPWEQGTIKLGALAILLDAIEDPQSGHGALQLNPRNAERLLELFGR